MNPVFSNDSFELCVLSNPSGYPNSYTHVGIEYSQNGYNGYHYFMSQSPFPSGNDHYENPCFYYANPRSGNRPPIEWIAYSGNPLQEDPGDGYNADPDILFFNDDLYVTNRPYLRTPKDYQWVNAFKCDITGGSFSFGQPVTLFDTDTTPENFGYPTSYIPTLVSPSFIKKDNKIRSYHFVTNSSNDGSQCRNLVIMEGTDFETEQNFSFLKYGSIYGHVEPWHLDVFENDGKLYMIVCGVYNNTPNRTYNYMAVSEDWENFRIYKRPLSNYMSYRSSGFVREDGMFIFYLTTLNNMPPGNVTVDGRNIFCSYMPWNDVISRLESTTD